MSRRTKRGVILGDFHCGHWCGLTPPDFWTDDRTDDPINKSWAGAQREFWKWYASIVRSVGKVDYVIANADLIDGRGDKSGSTELITSDRNRQLTMAVQCLKAWEAPVYKLTRGTPYHVGKLEQFEDNIADAVDGEIADHLFPEINGVVFDIKHKIGSSAVPHGRATAQQRAALWNQILSDPDSSASNTRPRAQVIIRSHVHYHKYSGDPDTLAMTLPCLQLPMTRYGLQQCDGRVDVGLTVWEIKPSGSYTWRSEIARMQCSRAATSVI